MSASKTASKPAKEKESGRKQFGPKDYRVVCDWLEIDGNLEGIFGAEGKTKFGVRYPTKKLAFLAMADYINERQLKGSTLAKVDWQGAKNRFTHLHNKYKKAKERSNCTGFGLTEADEADGVHSISQKLEQLCPCFEKLDVIFGDNPKVDVASNLFSSALTSEMPPDYLTQDNSTLNRPFIDLEEGEENLAAPGPMEENAAREMPNLDENGDAVLQAVAPTSIADNPGGDGSGTAGDGSGTAPPDCEGPSLQSDSGVPATPFISAKNKVKSGSSLPNKRRSIEKQPTSFTSMFSSNMESMNQGKLKSLELKEKAMEQKHAIQSIRVETAQHQLKISQQQIDLEAHRVRLEERKMEDESTERAHRVRLEERKMEDEAARRAHQVRLEERKMEDESATRAKEFAETSRARKVQARIDVIKSMANRDHTEIEAILKMIEDVD